MSLSEVGAYAKAGKSTSIAQVRAKGARMEKSRGTKMNFRMSKAMDKKITSKLVTSIEASHLYPVARITTVKEDKTTGLKTVTLLSGTERITELKQWIIICNGSGNESATAIDPFECDADGRLATTDCKLSKERLKGAYIYFGPQPQLSYDTSLASALMSVITAFPKTKQKIQLLPTTYEKLLRDLA